MAQIQANWLAKGAFAVTVVAAVAVVGAGSFAHADDAATLADNGYGGDTTTTITNTNDVSVTNSTDQSAQSGNVNSSGNTSSGNATSGSVSNSNTNSTSVTLSNF